MLDLETLAQNFSEPLQTYCGIAQYIRAGADIPPEELGTPRIVWDITKSYLPGAYMPVISWKAVPGTIDPQSFSQDIEKTVISNPRAIFSFVLYGNPGDSNNNRYIQKAREWFAAPLLGPEFLAGYDVVVADVTEIQNRVTDPETNSQERRGFDVTFQFNEKVSIVIPAIEEAVDNGTITT
ncbi:MAG TPA: hypothetical protein VHY08_11705 [Bacillota bacterium]|nr:hypothetical protein [Bacillota bacterium]